MTSNAGASVKRHTCPDETATVVNGRWICNCPGGPYPAPPAKSPLPAQAGGAPVTPSALESASDAFGRPHGVQYDVLGWICSVCNGWNHSRDRLCAHTHRNPQPAAEGEKS